MICACRPFISHHRLPNLRSRALSRHAQRQRRQGLHEVIFLTITEVDTKVLRKAGELYTTNMSSDPRKDKPREGQVPGISLLKSNRYETDRDYAQYAAVVKVSTSCTDSRTC
jgi:hypothetical protein